MKKKIGIIIGIIGFIIFMMGSIVYYNHYTNIDQLPSHIFEEMRHFFAVYKNLENKTTAVNEVSGRDEALRVIRAALDLYVEKFCK